jgi:glycosyltransferase involved in cell wall biosynthesis
MPLVASDAFRFGISPNKLFDYAAAGRPIVFAVTGHLGVFGDGKAGPVAPSSDPASLAQAIAGLVATPADEVEAMGRVAFERGQQHHDLRKLARRFLCVCEQSVRVAHAEVPESRLNGAGSDQCLPGRERHG